MTPRVLAACGGFLLAVLWMDLLFDIQVRRIHDDADRVIGSIAAYYRRVTTEAFPMNRLVGVVMVLTLAVSVRQVLAPPNGRARALLALALASGAIGLALARVVANAVRLGARTDSAAVQVDLARAIYRDHVRCLVLMSAFVALELSM